MSVPMWHANYADDKGHLMFVFDGLVPKRNGHDYTYWSKVVAGDTSDTMWTDYLSFDELPKVIDPAVGWTQNTNQPPWDASLPLLDRTKYAPYVAPSGEHVAADADAPITTNDDRGRQDQLRVAHRQETFNAHGTRGSCAS